MSKIWEVRIYTLNEWGYRYYKIMLGCGYHIEVSGEKGEVLYQDIVKNEAKKMGFVPEKAFLNVYAKGTSFVCLWNHWDRTVKNKAVEQYIRQVQNREFQGAGEIIGVIIMNCNP